MKEEIYQWMKNVTVFYVVFQAVVQLLPEKKYEKYVRFYMGILLILLLLSPVFMILGKSEALWQDFGAFYRDEELYRLEREAQNLEMYYLQKAEEWENEASDNLE